jgi:hypothetical protein
MSTYAIVNLQDEVEDALGERALRAQSPRV